MFQDFENENKGDDFLNEFRQKVANQPNDNFEQRRDELKRSKSVFLGAVSGVAMAAIVGWFILAPKYEDIEDVEVPVVRRPQELVKTIPTDPGGMEILNQDKTVYDIIEKKSGDEKTAETLLPPPEEPKVPATVEVNTIEEVIENVEVLTPNEPKPIVVPKEAEVNEIAKVEAKPMPKTENVTAENMIKIVESANEPPAKISEAIINKSKAGQKPKVVTSSEFDEELKSKGIPVGSWQIQMMSSPNKKAVEGSFAGLAKKYTGIAGQPYEIETADLKEKGVFYRLKVGAFRDKTDADSLCNEVKNAKGTCIVVKKK